MDGGSFGENTGGTSFRVFGFFVSFYLPLKRGGGHCIRRLNEPEETTENRIRNKRTNLGLV